MRQRVEESLKQARLDLARNKQGYFIEENRSEMGKAEAFIIAGVSFSVSLLAAIPTGGLGAPAGLVPLIGYTSWRNSKKIIRYAPISVSEYTEAETFLNNVERLLQNGYVLKSESKMQEYKAPRCRRA